MVNIKYINSNFKPTIWSSIMEDTFTDSILTFVIIGVTTMIAFVSLIIIYVTISQRKAARLQLNMQEMRNQHQKDIFKSILVTQEKERKRIAQNLHDDIGTSLSATGLLVSQIHKIGTPEIQRTIIQISDNINTIIQETRRAINDLSPSSLKTFGLFAVLEELSMLIHSSANIKLEINSDIKESRLSNELELTLYRIIKEFCNNSIKHSQASKISLNIKIEQGNLLTVSIYDDGDGFNINTIKNEGHGLKNMESRVYLLGGTSKLSSELGVGTMLKIELPLTNEDLNKLNSEL